MIEKSYIVMLVHDEIDIKCMYSNRFLEFC